MVWPDLLSHRYLTVTVLENPASWLHLIGGLIAAYLGCPGRYLAAYAFYQLYTTTAKTLLFPTHGLSDWSWDFVGDNLEFLAGIGLGVTIFPERRAAGTRKLCNGKYVAALLGLLTITWLAALTLSLAS